MKNSVIPAHAGISCGHSLIRSNRSRHSGFDCDPVVPISQHEQRAIVFRAETRAGSLTMLNYPLGQIGRTPRCRARRAACWS